MQSTRLLSIFTLEVNTAFVIHKLSREATTGPRRTPGQGHSGQEPLDRVTLGREPPDKVSPGREALDRVTPGREPRLVRMGAGMAQGPMEIAEHHQQDFPAPASSSPGNTARPPQNVALPAHQLRPSRPLPASCSRSLCPVTLFPLPCAASEPAPCPAPPLSSRPPPPLNAADAAKRGAGT